MRVEDDGPSAALNPVSSAGIGQGLDGVAAIERISRRPGTSGPDPPTFDLDEYVYAGLRDGVQAVVFAYETGLVTPSPT